MVPSRCRVETYASGNRRVIRHTFFRAGISYRDVNISDEIDFGEISVAAQFENLPPVAMQLLIAIARNAGQSGRFIPYRPTSWLAQKPTCRNRSRWSRWTRRMTVRGLLWRSVETGRDRVCSVAVTPDGWNWLVEQCGEGALVDLPELDWTST